MDLKKRLEDLGYTVLIHESKQDIIYVIIRVDTDLRGCILVDKEDNHIWKINYNGVYGDFIRISELVEGYNNED